MNEQTSNPTSGQNVPESKFRRKSRQEQTAASKLRMERRGEKLDAAREKLAKQKPPKKPGAVKRLAHTAGHGVHGFVHGKLYEVEHENVGTEGAHRSELAAEAVYRFGRRKLRKAIREHPAKAVERAESKHIKATADYYYRKTVEEHPEMQERGAVSRYLQKQKIKRQYAKQAREAARQTAKAAEGAITVFGENLRQLLLQPPIRGKTVMGLDPGYRMGCKVAVVDPTGKVLDTNVVYPVPEFKRVDQAKKIIKSNKVVDLINLLYKYPVINASTVTALTSIPSATATRYLNALVESKILYPNDMVRNRTFYYYNLLDIIR